jgi:hypothetical protein
MNDLDLRTARRAKSLLARHREGYAGYLDTLASVGGAVARLEVDRVANEVESAGRRLGELADDAVELAAVRAALTDASRSGPLVESARADLRTVEQLVDRARVVLGDVIARLQAAQGFVATELQRTVELGPYHPAAHLPAVLLDRTG